jgi:hypothetical protein
VKTENLLNAWRSDPIAFRREAIILESGKPFGEVADQWQLDDFAEIDRHRHAFLLRPRGHSKTADAGTEVVADLVLGPRGQRIYGAAVDSEQAEIMFEDVVGKFQRSSLLRNAVKIVKREISVPATGSRFRILTSDAPSAYGLRPDRIIVDELAEWAKRDLWDSLWSATGKRPGCRILCISTAGWDKTSICWEVQQIAEREADWYFSARGPCASWISKEWLEQQRRTLPPHVFARLHEARWVDGVGAFLTSEEVDAVFDDPLPHPLVGRTAIGLDIGLTRDRTVAAVVRNLGGLCIVQALIAWQGRPGRKVDLEQVEAEVKALASRFSAPVHFDPYQGIQMGQRLQRLGVATHEYPFTGESRRRLFGLILDLVRTRRLRSEPHKELRSELLGLEATETAAGWRVDHKPGRHDDHVIAVALAAQAVAGQPVTLTPEHFIGGGTTMHVPDTSRWECDAELALMPWATDGLRRSDDVDTERERRDRAKALALLLARRPELQHFYQPKKEDV